MGMKWQLVPVGEDPIQVHDSKLAAAAPPTSSDAATVRSTLWIPISSAWFWRGREGGEML
jgi:hypothetical protein